MKIVHVASELFPFIKTGGLADSVASQAKTLARFGHKVSVIIPGYRAVMEHPGFASARRVLELLVELGDRDVRGEVYALDLAAGETLYVVRRDEFFDRTYPYGVGTMDYDDNAARFIFFDKAVVEILRLLKLKADVVHCHDWQAGMVPVLLRAAEAQTGTTLALSTVLTIHNIAFQGVFPRREFALTNLPDEFFNVEGVEFYGQMNMLKAGLVFADRITTVSPNYAREIRTSTYGAGLDGVVRSRGGDLVGILNGIDTEIWNPETDPHLPARYSVEDLSGKAVCRRALLEHCGFAPEDKGPLMGMVCRLAHQKGIDLVLGSVDALAKLGIRLVILGNGDRDYEAALAEAREKYPENIYHDSSHDEALSHLIEAGADFFLMPSIFEPCGLNQMYSMRYGTVPVVSNVGGLVDTVTDIEEDPENGTGIVVRPDVRGVIRGYRRAVDLYANRELMARAIRNGMRRDFSWEKAARAYEALYREIV
ncbi:MAG: glycogen synthase GlgA [Verrucomicrobia bacterium]|nr:MAG: glycogen synthase GlgA [Verrucomicrobiota bacterium]